MYEVNCNKLSETSVDDVIQVQGSVKVVDLATLKTKL